MEGTVKVEKYIMADDNRLNYCFIKPEEFENPNKDNKVEWDEIDRTQIDYGIVIEKGEPETEESVGTLDKTILSSMLAIKNEDDAVDWYKEKHPELPDGMAEIFAKYHYGDKDNTQGVKGTHKGDCHKKKNKKNKNQKFEVKRGKFKVVFD